MAAKPLPAGGMIAGRYRAIRKIAAGAMGEVWVGEHNTLRLRVALKVLLKEAQANDEVTARFWREAFLLGQIRSDHVARVLDFVTDSGHGPVLVMEFVDGPSLADVLQMRRLTVEEAVDLGIDIACALRELHGAHVVHRDVKPANIIMRPLPDGLHRAVFVDLGVSRFVQERELQDDERMTEITSADRAVGTMEYMAPEQILSSRTVTAAADLYALGAILYRAVTGRHVFGEVRGHALARLRLSGDPPALDTGRTDRVAKGLEAVVARALARAPEERYELADEVLADLSLLRDTARRVAKNVARSTPPPAPAAPSRGRGGDRAGLSFTAALVLVWTWAGSLLKQVWKWRVLSSLLALVAAVIATAVIRTGPRPAPPPKPLHAAGPDSRGIEALAIDGAKCTLVTRSIESVDAGAPRLTLSLVCEPGPQFVPSE